jgi:hypothetical protein
MAPGWCSRRFKAMASTEAAWLAWWLGLHATPGSLVASVGLGVAGPAVSAWPSSSVMVGASPRTSAMRVAHHGVAD